jgi:hypothetical protein
MCDGRHLNSVQFDVLIVGRKVKSDVASERVMSKRDTPTTFSNAARWRRQ